MNVERTKVLVSMEVKLVQRLDVLAEKVGMSRSKFIETFMETTVDSEEPVINFAVKIGKLRSALLWPAWKKRLKIS